MDNILCTKDMEKCLAIPYDAVPKVLKQEFEKRLSTGACRLATFIYNETHRLYHQFGEIKPVIASREKFEKLFGVARTAIHNWISELRDKQLISTIQTKDFRGHRWVCKYWLTLPEDLKQIIHSTPNRASTRHYKVKEASVFKHISNSIADNLPESSIDPENKILDTFRQLQAEYKHLGPRASCQKAYSNFTKEEQQTIHEQLISESKIEEDKNHQNNNPCPNFAQAGIHKKDFEQVKLVRTNKSTTNKYNNCYINKEAKDIKQLIGKFVPLHIEPVDEQTKKQLLVDAKKKFEKYKCETGLLACLRDGKTEDDLISEAVYHAIHRDVNSTKSAIHALNAAFLMMRAGTWKTPLKLLCKRHAESIMREREWEREKEQLWAPISDDDNHGLEQIAS